MSAPPEAIKRQTTVLRTVLQKKQRKSSHRGVLLLAPGGKNLAWRVRYRDPETGRKLVKNLPSEAARNSDTREAYAKKLFRELQGRRQEIEEGSRPHTEAGNKIEAAIGRYFDGHDLNPKAEKIYRAASQEFLQWCDRFGVVTVRHLNKARLYEYRLWLKTAPKRVAVEGGRKGEFMDSDEARSPHSTNKHLRAMSAILNQLRAADVVRLTSDEIKDALKRYKAETERRSFLSQKQIAALLEEVKDEPIAPLVRCILLTGIRLEEALLIEWRDVEEDWLRIRAAVGKGGKKRDVDLRVAQTAFGERGEDNERVFTMTFGEVRGAYESAKQEWTPHALRRTWSTFFVAAFGPWRASKSAGHSVLVMERNYADLVSVPDGCRSLEAAMHLSAQ